jgi:transcriptional regulator with XRE-family HTH domain
MYLFDYEVFFRNVRVSEDGNIFSVEDIVELLCDTDNPRKLIMRLRKSVRKYCFEYDGLCKPNGRKWEKSSGLAVRDEDKLELIRALPGEKAKEFIENFTDYINYQSWRSRFIAHRVKKWKEVGADFRSAGENMALSLAEVSRRMGTSATRLRNFENGAPVLDAKLIEQSYLNFLDLHAHERKKAVNEEQSRLSEIVDQLKHPWIYASKEDHDDECHDWDDILVEEFNQLNWDDMDTTDTGGTENFM